MKTRIERATGIDIHWNNIMGDRRSGKTTALAAITRNVLSTIPDTKALWISPNIASADAGFCLVRTEGVTAKRIPSRKITFENGSEIYFVTSRDLRQGIRLDFVAIDGPDFFGEEIIAGVIPALKPGAHVWEVREDDEETW